MIMNIEQRRLVCFVRRLVNYCQLDYNPAYEPVPSGYDVALLKLYTPLTFDAFVDWAYLAARPNPLPGALLTAAGWGRTEEGVLSDTLKSVSIQFNAGIVGYSFLHLFFNASITF